MLGRNIYEQAFDEDGGRPAESGAKLFALPNQVEIRCTDEESRSDRAWETGALERRANFGGLASGEIERNGARLNFGEEARGTRCVDVDEEIERAMRCLSTYQTHTKEDEHVLDEFDETKPLNTEKDKCALCKEDHAFGLLLNKLFSQPHGSNEDSEKERVDKWSVSADVLDADKVWASKFSLPHKKWRLFVHYMCAFAAPRVWFTGSQWHNLKREVNRGLQLRCAECGKGGATIGCEDASCKAVYHFHCAYRNGFRMPWSQSPFHCPEHHQLLEAATRLGNEDGAGDLSRGLEQVPVSFSNALDDANPLDNFHYTSTILDSDTVVSNSSSVEDLPCCTCEDSCEEDRNCLCLSSGVNYSFSDAQAKPQDDSSQQQRPLLFNRGDRIVECNFRCSCSMRRCRNRVVQNGLTFRLEVFRVKASVSSEPEEPPRSKVSIFSSTLRLARWCDRFCVLACA